MEMSNALIVLAAGVAARISRISAAGFRRQARPEPIRQGGANDNRPGDKEKPPEAPTPPSRPVEPTAPPQPTPGTPPPPMPNGTPWP